MSTPYVLTSGRGMFRERRFASNCAIRRGGFDASLAKHPATLEWSVTTIGETAKGAQPTDREREFAT